MRRTLLRIAIAVLTFSLGVGVSVGWQLYQWSLVPYEVSPTCCDTVAVVETPQVTRPSEITIVGGLDACGPEANYHTRELSDGTRISQSCETWSSPLAAARRLKTRLSNAQIVERSEERDEKGRIIGQKILTAGPRVMKLTIYGKNLCVTEAPSLEHLRLYESGALHYSFKN
jgi:hypothetical protein